MTQATLVKKTPQQTSQQSIDTSHQSSPTTIPPQPPLTLGQLREALSRRLPETMLDSKKVGKGQNGRSVSYLPWYNAVRILEKYSPGWSWEITKFETTSDRLILYGQLTLITSDGPVTRGATGTEALKEIFFNEKTNQHEWRDISYGDPSSNAESMAFRRAAAKFGLGLYLYDK